MDLDILDRFDDFQIIRLPHYLQSFLVTLFHKKVTSEFPKFDEFFDNTNCSITKDAFTKCNKKLANLLKHFLGKLKVDVIISASLNYKRDYILGYASQQIGCPYVVFHRENLITNDMHRNIIHSRWTNKGTSPVSHIVVHNNVMRNILINSGYVSQKNISALGCMRISNIIKKVNMQPEKSISNKKTVSLFSFHFGVGLYHVHNFFSREKPGYIKFFDAVHQAIAQLALEYPDVNFIIKPKWGGDWIKAIAESLHLVAIDYQKISNLSIDPDVDVHDLLIESDVVCGFGSTTLLESLICKKKPIMPVFSECEQDEFKDYLIFKDELDYFQIATSSQNFKDMILYNLNFPERNRIVGDTTHILDKYLTAPVHKAPERYSIFLQQFN